ncbi:MULTISPECIES: hypothetical protein [unclassified Ruminococcus]|uniref:hypothetical protein n=1 Tax=unclassified Ruminococcus TaxID=2608920 RepID=UPI00210BC5A3|nr:MULTISPECIES: hypothetical protein [unclassified Ruminococcus]MCQ4022625.1 hypothetical protein [Ruminococcus sp. zg-924]MCQ4114865.1 hypothetical protein [Ruminococcus sp. zg-921]
MDKKTSLSQNTVILAVYFKSEDDADKNGDILSDARRRYFTTHKKIKDRVFFTSGIDSVRCRYMLDNAKPMKWLKEVNGKTTELSVADSSGSYTVVCSNQSGDILKKIYFSRTNIWQKSEYYSRGAVTATLTACSNDNGLSIAVQYPGKPAQILTPYKDKGETESEIIVTAKTLNGEYFFAAAAEESFANTPDLSEENIQRKGFFFDASLMYGDFTTLNIKNSDTSIQEEKSENKPENVNTDLADENEKTESEAEITENKKISEEENVAEAVLNNESDNNTYEEEQAGSITDNGTPNKIIENSPKEKYCYFGSLSKKGERDGGGVTVTEKGSVLYCGGYNADKRSGFGAQFFKNGKISYVGKWSEDKKNGFGITFLNDGSISAGGFENDRKKGTAARFTSDGKLSSVVCYKNDEPHGAAITVDSKNESLVVQKCDNGKMKNPATVLDLSGNIVYNGEMSDGKYNGTGRLFDKSGALMYYGEFKDGLQNGYGVLYLDDNSFVSGEFLNGQIKGEATHRLQDGTLIYKGGFKDGEYHGKGTIYKSDGSYYSTSFENGREKGAISVYSKSGELLYKGGLKNGEYSGKGALYLGGAKVYEGSFVGGKKCGLGRVFSDNLCEYMGSFDDDKKSGFGISYKNNEAVYTGFWLEDKYSGQGVLHDFESNSDFAGMFENGEMCGRINVISGEYLLKECIYEYGKCTYMREYDKNGCVLYEGSAANGIREGMGCSYTSYGEKQFEGIFKYGEPYKAMRVIPKTLSELEYCEKLKDTAYHKYKKPPVFVSEQLVGKGIYSGSLVNGKPSGSGTMLYTDHRYTGRFKNGKPCGEGVLYFGDGKELKGEFFEKANDDASPINFADAVYYLKNGGDEK